MFWYDENCQEYNLVLHDIIVNALFVSVCTVLVCALYAYVCSSVLVIDCMHVQCSVMPALVDLITHLPW